MLGMATAAQERRISRFAMFASVLAGFALLAMGPAESLAAKKNCGLKPSKCGYPDKTNTGVKSKRLRTIPGKETSGPGWRWNGGGVTISTPGTVFARYKVNGTIDVTADNVVIRNVRVIQSGDTFGIAIRRADNTRIKNCKVGPGKNDRRLHVGIKDIYGDADGTLIKKCEIYGVATGIQIPQGEIRRNYIHDLRQQSGDHLNGITTNGGQKKLKIIRNTVFNEQRQTDAIGLFPDFSVEANRTVRKNLIGGGGYTLYGGAKSGKPNPYKIKIIGNRFTRHLYPKGGYYGPVTAYYPHGQGNVWKDNVWDDTNQSLPTPH